MKKQKCKKEDLEKFDSERYDMLSCQDIHHLYQLVNSQWFLAESKARREEDGFYRAMTGQKSGGRKRRRNEDE